MKKLQATALIAVILTCLSITITWFTYKPYAPKTNAVQERPVEAAATPNPIAKTPGSELTPAQLQSIARLADAVERADAQQPQAAPKQPESHLATIALLPGQSYNLLNKKFRKVVVRSEYPVRVYTGKCHSDYTVLLSCEGDPADIFLTDVRHTPLFETPRSNTVDVRVTEF